MKHLIAILAVLALISFGCQHPDQVELTPAPEESANQVDITSLASADTGSAGVFDSTAIPPAVPDDGTRFGASLSIVRSEYDFGRSGQQNVVLAFSRVVFEDRALSLPGSIGFFGQHLAGLTLNGVRMDTVRHYIRVPNVGVLPFGVEYVKWLGGLYQSQNTYTWRLELTTSSLNTPFSIQTPSDLVVLSPIGGAQINRSLPLELRWSGKGNVAIVVSAYNPLLNTSRPLLYLKPALNNGRLVLLPRVLTLLPRHRYFVFTFILNNRKEVTVTGYSWRVLVQASSVYNSFVEVF